MSTLQRPCIKCSDLIDNGSYCAECRPKPTRNSRSSHPSLHTARWTRLSKKLRTQSPQCELCGSTDRLHLDHLVSPWDKPEWAFETANTRVACGACNTSRGRDTTDELVALVQARIDAKKRRIRTVRGIDKTQQPRCAVNAPEAS